MPVAVNAKGYQTTAEKAPRKVPLTCSGCLEKEKALEDEAKNREAMDSRLAGSLDTIKALAAKVHLLEGHLSQAKGMFCFRRIFRTFSY